MLLNPSNGWMAVLMTAVDAKTSDIHELNLELQKVGAAYRITDVRHGGYNPVTSKGSGYLGLGVFVGKTCNVSL